ncbi:MAG: hypothetical protein HN712_08580 [Gemmatimonadetes bacterium]|jgi:hypothetical protein|nr:hypothetical protein [Gemmatimonadota bacterium]MBT7860355.1 hypothetical protein [Gemmatimonadota bacterium]
MRAVFTFTPAESKRLIARGVAQCTPVVEALENAYVVIAGGTTNGFIAQELGGLDVDPEAFTAGTSSQRVLCVTPAAQRDDRIPIVLYKGERVERTMAEVFEDFHLDTVVIKGANAVDSDGNVGVITSGFDGGTVAATIGTMTSTGMRYVFPVGLEKLVPSVPEACRWLGAKRLDYSMGATFGMYCLNNGLVFTECDALQTMAGVEAIPVAAGGIGGSEGAVTLAVHGARKDMELAIEIAESVKGEPAVPSLKGQCTDCPYENCAYHGKSEDELPDWLRAA